MPFPVTAQKTIMSYFHTQAQRANWRSKTFGQNMQRKTPNKFLMSKRHLLFKSVLLVILVRKSHILSINTFNSVVPYGNFMGVTSQIFHYRFGTSKRFLSKNNPLVYLNTKNLLLYPYFIIFDNYEPNLFTDWPCQ